jgi:hypothetical protein
MFHFSLQLLFKTYYTPKNILQVTPEICTETHVNLHIKCTLLLSDFNQNWNMSTNVNKTPHYQIWWKSIPQLLAVTCRKMGRHGVSNVCVCSQRFVMNASKIILHLPVGASPKYGLVFIVQICIWSIQLPYKEQP